MPQILKQGLFFNKKKLYLKSKDLIINCKLAMNASLANLQVVFIQHLCVI